MTYLALIEVVHRALLVVKEHVCPGVHELFLSPHFVQKPHAPRSVPDKPHAAVEAILVRPVVGFTV